MPKLYPMFAIFFVWGVLVAFAFYLLIKLADMESGMSAGSVPASSSIAPLIVSFEMYFLMDVVANLLPQNKVRRTLAAASHIALMLAVIYLSLLQRPPESFRGCAAAL